MIHGESKENSHKQLETQSGAQQRARDYYKVDIMEDDDIYKRTEIRPHKETRNRDRMFSEPFGFDIFNCGLRQHGAIYPLVVLLLPEEGYCAVKDFHGK